MILDHDAQQKVQGGARKRTETKFDKYQHSKTVNI